MDAHPSRVRDFGHSHLDKWPFSFKHYECPFGPVSTGCFFQSSNGMVHVAFGHLFHLLSIIPENPQQYAAHDDLVMALSNHSVQPVRWTFRFLQLCVQLVMNLYCSLYGLFVCPSAYPFTLNVP